MSYHSERYFELIDRIGGVNSEALDSMFYWNNPLALKHWTMNIGELLYIGGAVLAVSHATKQFRQHGNISYLAFILSMFVYFVLAEVPIYFPQLIGLPPDIIFIHNEFSLGVVYNMTPFYIICLYPALLYSTYLFVEKLGVFDRSPMIVGAICVGFIHSCLYEVFDQFGIQYNWWIWDYENPINYPLIAGLPLLSIANFSLIPPIAMTILARTLLFKNAEQNSTAKTLAKVLIVGTLTPLVMFVIAPTTITTMITDSIPILTWVSWITLAITAAVTISALITAGRAQSLKAASGDEPLWRTYPFNYMSIYLVVFAILWIVCIGDYNAAVDGVTPFGTYIGSLPYVLGCYVFGLFFLYQFNKARK